MGGDGSSLTGMGISDKIGNGNGEWGPEGVGM